MMKSSAFAENEIKSVSSAAADFITLVISSRKGFHSFSQRETDLIAAKGCYACFLYAVGERRMRIGKSSSLPASILKQRISFEKSE